MVNNYRFSKNFVLKAENFMPLDKVTLVPHFGNIMNQRIVFKDFIEGKRSKMSFETIYGGFGWHFGSLDLDKSFVLIQPPPVFGLTKKPGLVWLGLRYVILTQSYPIFVVLMY